MKAGNTVVYDAPMPAARNVIALKDLDVPPGETQLTLTASGPTTKSDDFTPGEVIFKMERPRVVIAPAGE